MPPVRLLTEEEWEYAPRAGSQTLYPWGDDESLSGNYAWYSDNSDGTHQVATRRANFFGLHDMSGNVWEWTDSLWDQTIVARGGGWDSRPLNGRFGFRRGSNPYGHDNNLGFRLVKTLTL